ncbi:MAG: tetratricopeptide repeat protein [Sphingomicrobium sp.]
MNADIGEVARRLEVDYVLDGSVRTQDDRVRVTAALLRTSDARRLWSDSYDGRLDDIFEIQQRIGSSVAGALRRKLVKAVLPSGPLVTNGEAYNLYLTARGLIRTYKRQDGATAVGLLRDAIKIDPDFAPAWASLAEATQLEGATSGYEGLAEATPRAERYARHALKLAPDLAQAHRTLGMLLPFGTPSAQAHLRHAAELDPNTAENFIWLGVSHGAAGEFKKEQDALRKAVQLDPYWFRTTAHAAVAAAEMGNRAEAEAIVRRGSSKNEVVQHLLLGRIAWIFGDFSEAARRLSIVARSDSSRWGDTARRHLNDANYAIGLTTHTLAAVPPPNDQRRLTTVWIEVPPAPSVWRLRNRSPSAAGTYRDYNHKAAKLMLLAGRGRELVSAYDSPHGLLTLLPNDTLRVDQLPEAPVIALALRQAGRSADESKLLREANAAVHATYRRGRVPFWFDASAAAIRAVQGRRDEALSMLERAERRGWTHTANTDLRDIGDEPAFRSLKGDARFERLRARLAAHQARERRETENLRL